jgi:hypothetical protein
MHEDDRKCKNKFFRGMADNMAQSCPPGTHSGAWRRATLKWPRYNPGSVLTVYPHFAYKMSPFHLPPFRLLPISPTPHFAYSPFRLFTISPTV